MQFVLSIEANGMVSGLQSKPGKGFDLRTLGKAEIERASEVLWSHDEQAWFVHIERGTLKGALITTGMIEQARGGLYPELHRTAYFAEYDEAVEHEILVLDHLRAKHGAAYLR